MKVLISPDSFKDSLTSVEAAQAIAAGLQRASEDFEVRMIPVADGGEGTVQAIVSSTNGQININLVHDPLMRVVEAQWGITGSGNTAVIEMAAASGIELLEDNERNPWHTTTFGTGELIKYALDKGCRRFIIGIGGSATNDGGIGMAMALGVKFYNSNNKEIGFGGGALSELDYIDTSGLDQRINQSEFIIACDVTNPLTGKNGASFVYGRQKGADKQMQQKLDDNLKKYASLIKSSLHIEVDCMPGAGAAGGLGAGMFAFLGGKLQRGFDIVQNEVNLHEHCQWADIIITGEGKMDNQTQYGKTPFGVAQIARKYDKDVLALCGTLGKDYSELYKHGFKAIFSIVDKPMDLQLALSRANELLEKTAFAVGRTLI
jgi:glycerate kinase